MLAYGLLSSAGFPVDPAPYRDGHPTISFLSPRSPRFKIPCQNQGGLNRTSNQKQCYEATNMNIHITTVIEVVIIIVEHTLSHSRHFQLNHRRYISKKRKRDLRGAAQKCISPTWSSMATGCRLPFPPACAYEQRTHSHWYWASSRLQYF